MKAIKAFRVAVMDAEGAVYEYVITARSRRDAMRQAREWVARSDWATAVVGVPPIYDRNRATGRRLVVVAGVTLAAAGSTIAAMMILALSLEGAL
jgi:hypothetical protein